MLDSPEWIARLTPSSPHALSKVRQLYLALYEAITRGELGDGQQLPSSRQLASHLSLGRNTVIAVYAQLHDEGLIVSDGRRGTRVTHQAAGNLSRSDKDNPSSLALLSRRSVHERVTSAQHVALAPGMPDPELFPSTQWRKALNVASRLTPDNLGYKGIPLPQLQQALCRYLAIYRSLHVEPEQIIITSGTRQSLALAAALYADPGDTAWVESPGYLGAIDAFRMQGLQLRAMSVDTDGTRMPSSDSTDAPALIYLTPCFQYPTGAPLDASRRAAVLKYARQHDCMIFEDDYDSEFRDDSQARPALASQQAVGDCNVLHAGTFSKLIFPAARIAWLVVPSEHVTGAHRCLRTLGGGHNSVAQATIAEIVDNGSLAKHLQRARGVYTQRRLALLSALEDTGLFEPLTDTGGSLSLVAVLKTPIAAKAMTRCTDEQRLGVQFLEEFLWHKRVSSQVSALVLGLGNVSTLKIPGTVDRLASAITQASE